MLPVSRNLRRRAMQQVTMGANEFPEFHTTNPAPQPAPVKVVSLSLPPARPTNPGAVSVTTSPAAPQPSDPVRAPSPSTVTTVTCPPVWPWWWCAVALTAGAAAGVWAAQDKGKKLRKNGRRVVHRIVNAGARRAAAALF